LELRIEKLNKDLKSKELEIFKLKEKKH